MRLVPKILFIDDDKFFLEFYQSELAQYNVNTEFALDGEEGIEKAKELNPDVILLDVILPKKDGFEVLEELKKNDKTKDIPVVIISGLSAKKDLDKLLQLGAVKTFNKLTHLPKDVAGYVQSLIENKVPQEEVSSNKETSLSGEKINAIFSDSLQEIEGSFRKMFEKGASLEDFNVSLIPDSTFNDNIEELSKTPGTIFIYGEIEAEEPGLAILSIKRDDTLSLIKLIEKGMVGKELDLKSSDRVIEEFFNIIINAFLNKLSSSVPGRLILTPPKINSPEAMKKVIDEAKVKKHGNKLVVFLEEAYTIESLDLSFSIFITFGGGLFKK